MELIEAIKTRRAVRKFKNKEVPKEIIEQILEDSRWAPILNLNRRHEFAIVTGETRDRVADLLTQNTAILADLFALLDDDHRQKALKYYENLGDAPAFLFITIPKIPEGQDYARRMATIYPITELTLIWLLAHNLGLAACGIVVPPYVGQQINEELGIENREIICGISLGYPDEQPKVGDHPRVKATYFG